MEPMHFDRKGLPMTSEDWSRSFEDAAARRVALDKLENGYEVSTVWLGLNHGFGPGPPLIFETLVFGPDGRPDDEECERYSTEAEALAGHVAMVERWRAKSPAPKEGT